MHTDGHGFSRRREDQESNRGRRGTRGMLYKRQRRERRGGGDRWDKRRAPVKIASYSYRSVSPEFAVPIQSVENAVGVFGESNYRRVNEPDHVQGRKVA